MPAVTFGERLHREFNAGRRLCAGIDPHRYLLEEWSLPDTALGAEQLGLRVIEASRGHAAAVKPQVAFFERFGAAGYAALETVIGAAREAKLLVIADAKRGDVGSSFDAYAEAWLRPGSPLESDAVTAVAFQGFEVLDQALNYAREFGKGVFVLAVTSNPEAKPIQTALVSDGSSVSEFLLQRIHTFNRTVFGESDLGSIGAVLGATVELAEYGVDISEGTQQDSVKMPVLAPGFGHQGGTIEHARRSFGSYFDGVLVSESRSVLSGDPAGITNRIRVRAEQLRDAFGEGKP